MHLVFKIVASLLLVSILVRTSPAGRAAEVEADKTALAVEALCRLQGVNLDTNPRLHETVLKVLERTRGTPSFVRLIRQFNLTNQSAGLLEVAAAQPAGESGVEAMRLLLAAGQTAPIRAVLEGTNVTVATRIAEAIGHAGQKEGVALLLPLVTEAARLPGLRRQAVRSLARTTEGARGLLSLAKEDKLGDDLKFAVSSELNNVRWPAVRVEAAKILPPVEGQNAQPLPPIAELLKVKGDHVNGARVYGRASPGCINCHVVNGQGTELGPDLSEIGGKLGKDALYEAILDPNAGISFGFEAFTIELKDGEEAYGLIASDTAEELAVKAVGGVVTKFKKSEIISRQPSKFSIMPTGLQQGLTAQELVDLVEYLTTLKKR